MSVQNILKLDSKFSYIQSTFKGDGSKTFDIF